MFDKHKHSDNAEQANTYPIIIKEGHRCSRSIRDTVPHVVLVVLLIQGQTR